MAGAAGKAEAEPRCITFPGDLAPALLLLMQQPRKDKGAAGTKRWVSARALAKRVAGAYDDDAAEVVVNMLVTLWIEGVVETQRPPSASS